MYELGLDFGVLREIVGHHVLCGIKSLISRVWVMSVNLELKVWITSPTSNLSQLQRWALASSQNPPSMSLEWNDTVGTWSECSLDFIRISIKDESLYERKCSPASFTLSVPSVAPHSSPCSASSPRLPLHSLLSFSMMILCGAVLMVSEHRDVKGDWWECLACTAVLISQRASLQAPECLYNVKYCVGGKLYKQCASRLMSRGQDHPYICLLHSKSEKPLKLICFSFLNTPPPLHIPLSPFFYLHWRPQCPWASLSEEKDINNIYYSCMGRRINCTQMLTLPLPDYRWTFHYITTDSSSLSSILDIKGPCLYPDESSTFV